MVRPYSAFERYYYVDLTPIPPDLDEDVSYDFFVGLRLQPIIAPTHQAGSLMSRDRTVWFSHHDVPDELMPDGQLVREIHFPGFDTPVYVQHEKRTLNKELPPSIIAKRAEDDEQQLRQEGAKGAPHQSHHSQHPSVTLPTPAAPAPTPLEVTITLNRPNLSTPVQELVKVTRHALSSCYSPTPAMEAVEVYRAADIIERVIFGFLIKQTSFKLAFSDHVFDEPTASDADCIAYVDSKPVCGSFLILNEPVRNLVAARSIL